MQRCSPYVYIYDWIVSGRWHSPLSPLIRLYALCNLLLIYYIFPTQPSPETSYSKDGCTGPHIEVQDKRESMSWGEGTDQLSSPSPGTLSLLCSLLWPFSPQHAGQVTKPVRGSKDYSFPGLNKCEISMACEKTTFEPGRVRLLHHQSRDGNRNRPTDQVSIKAGVS